MNLDRVGYTWDCSPYTGWGVIGVNFTKYWPGEARSVWPNDANRTQFNLPVFVGLGNDVKGWAAGEPSVAFPVFENLEILDQNIRGFDRYGTIITASRWNHDELAERGIASHMVHQGYDPELFHPGVRKPRTDGRFRVFSGGKAEYRKGQDLVLQGFRIFAEKHDDAVLHAAWSSPWPFLAATLAQTGAGAPPCLPGSAVPPNFAAWAQRIGIKRHQFEDVPLTPNHLMPDVLANMDCAIFASRIEGGTNIAAMECLGCGIPTIVSDTTGHLDLVGVFHRFGHTDDFADREMEDVQIEQIARQLEALYTSPPGILPDKEIKTKFGWPARIDELVGVLKDA